MCALAPLARCFLSFISLRAIAWEGFCYNGSDGDGASRVVCPGRGGQEEAMIIGVLGGTDTFSTHMCASDPPTRTRTLRQLLPLSVLFSTGCF